MDTKSTALLGYLSSGTGLLTVGTLAGVVTAKIPTVVIWFGIPSMACIVISMIFALRARRPLDVFPPALADKVVVLAEYYGKEDKAKAGFLSHWNLLRVLMLHPISIKSWNLHWAMRFSVGGVSLLLAPVIASLLFGPVPIRKIEEPRYEGTARPAEVVVERQSDTK